MSHRVGQEPKPESHPVRRYRVLGKRYEGGATGAIIEAAFAPGLELSLIQAGTLELAPEEPKFAFKREPDDRPLKSADKEG